MFQLLLSCGRRIPCIVTLCANKTKSKFLSTNAQNGAYKMPLEFLRSTTDSIYVSKEMDVDIDYTQYAPQSTAHFKLSGKYVSPSEFQYKLPEAGVPEFAFVGRSNVGKSSLISALLDENKLVTVSKTPGCTRNVNYYALAKSKEATLTQGNKYTAYLVDLPGYGFAKASKEDQKKWQEVIEGYLLNRDFSVLRRVYVLIDARHGIRQSDITMLKLLTEARLTHQVILTKSDLVSSVDLEKSLNSVFRVIMNKEFMLCLPIVHCVSTASNPTSTKKSARALTPTEVTGAKATNSYGKSRGLTDPTGMLPLKMSMSELILQPWQTTAERNNVGFQSEIPIPPPPPVHPTADSR